jgi:hypothetical protein
MKYKVVNKSGMQTYIEGDNGGVKARLLPLGTVFEASAQRPFYAANGKPIKDDMRQKQYAVTYLVMLDEPYNGKRQYAFTVQNRVKFAVPYTPPAEPAKKADEEKADKLKELEARIAALEIEVFDKDGDGIVTEEERGGGAAE